jgi:hypothetical protein
VASLVVRLIARSTQCRIVQSLVLEKAVMRLLWFPILVFSFFSGTTGSVNMKFIRRLNFAHHLIMQLASQKRVVQLSIQTKRASHEISVQCHSEAWTESVQLELLYLCLWIFSFPCDDRYYCKLLLNPDYFQFKD